MNESKITITPDFSKFFKAWVTINITSVYTDMLSFYEVASKLIVNLNNLKKAQNNSSSQMDSMVSQTEEYITYVRNYLTSWSTNIHTEWNNFLQDRTEYEQNFLAQLKETYDNFIKELQQIESNFLSEIQQYWSGKTTIIENTTEAGMNGLIAIYNKYKGKVDTWNTAITSDVNNDINDTKELMEQLQNKITTFETEQKAIINSKNDEWVKKANNFYNEYKNVAIELVDNTDLLEFVKNWGKNTPVKMNIDSLIIILKYFQEETPSDMETNDLWYKPSMNGVLYKYNGTNWEVEALRTDKLYSYKNRLYYLTDAITPVKTYTIDTPSNVSVLSYHDNLLYVRLHTTNNIYEINIETDTLTLIASNVSYLDGVSSSPLGNYSDRFLYYNNQYYFTYNDTSSAKNYVVNNFTDFANHNWTELELRNNYIFACGFRGIIKLLPIVPENSQNINSIIGFSPEYNMSYIEYILKGYPIVSPLALSNNQFMQITPSKGLLNRFNPTDVNPNGYGTEIWSENSYIMNDIGFAPYTSYQGSQEFTYQDDFGSSKYFVSKNYYYRIKDNENARRVALNNTSMIEDNTLENFKDIIEDYWVSSELNDNSTNIILHEFNEKVSQLMEIGYTPNV